MSWLFVTIQFPWPLIHGRWLRVYHLARALCAAKEKVAVLSFTGSDEGVQAYAAEGVSPISGPEGVHQSRGSARCRWGRYCFDARMAQAVAEHAGRYERVVLSGGAMLQYAPEAAAGNRVLADLVDDPYLEAGRRLDRPRGLWANLRRLAARYGRRQYEHTFLPYVTATTFVSEADCHSFQGRHPRTRVACVANGVDVDHFRRPAERSQHRSGPVVFLGHMSNPNNEQAARFLVREIAPRVWLQQPAARFQIVGADPTEQVRALAGPQVEVTGRVEDVRPYLWNAAVVVLPMVSGTGIKNKLLEAWAAQTAVVATPLACQGVPASAGENLLVGQTADELALKTAELLEHPERRNHLAAQGRLVVEQHFTWETAAARLREVAET